MKMGENKELRAAVDQLRADVHMWSYALLGQVVFVGGDNDLGIWIDAVGPNPAAVAAVIRSRVAGVAPDYPERAVRAALIGPFYLGKAIDASKANATVVALRQAGASARLF
jgi:hypothetical protein